jgi:cell division protein FtsI/penicillin-binding protein 2
VSGLHLAAGAVRELKSVPGVRCDQNFDRLYPSEALPSNFLGTVGCADTGSGGIELSYQEELGGRDGWKLVNRCAHDSIYHLVNAPGKKPRNGSDLYLTIDSRVQSIVDFELEQAVERYGAISGVAIVLDPYRGDILALSEKVSSQRGGTSSRSQQNALSSVSCIFEPGSTFKLITHSYLLDAGDVDPYDVFYGENGKADFPFGTFRDDHEFEWLTFKESFVFSSNICTIKAVMVTDRLDFYGYIRKFGFGGWTGIKLPAESRGKLSSPEQWSARSLPSLAIGQEIGVTALQLVMAYGALANGGTLVVPRVSLAVRNDKGRIIKEYPPVTVRRVFSRETAATMKDFCREVVLRGTGKRAAVKGIPVAGKTGTAQKAGVNGYEPGRYIESFIGFAPIDEPKLVCLVILDEPSWRYHWGGESSAIVFSKIIEGINLSTDLLFGRGEKTIAFGPGDDAGVAVPNFLRLTAGEAVKLASSHGLRITSTHNAGIVYSQIPDPGSLIERGGEVKLLLRTVAYPSSDRVRVPDLDGLSIREARRLLIACGLRCRIEGSGVVIRQKPKHGRSVRCNSAVTLYCRSSGGDARPGGLALVRGGQR